MGTPSINETGPLLLSLKDAADLLGLSEWQVRGLTEDGTLASKRVPKDASNGRIYIPTAAVHAYVAGSSEQSA